MSKLTMLAGNSSEMLEFQCPAAENGKTRVQSLASQSKVQKQSHSELLSGWVEEHSDYLFRYASRYFKDSSSAEDAVQEAFLAATQAISKFEGKSTPRTWLTGILRHKILDRLRKVSKEDALYVQPQDNETAQKLFDEHEHWTLESGPLPWKFKPDASLEQKEFLNYIEEMFNKGS